ncbi:oxidase [Lithospermum erythrorhizon]|uniref:Oxidase n=1 Tax=Lithospermum erythrorhizon TaxID=34254 RepID=A0AAV3QSB3_LITER
MGGYKILNSLIKVVSLLFLLHCVNGEDPYRFYNWKVTYGNIYPLGVKQQGILINGMFPGPQISCVTNDNLIISVHNHLNEPFLISW